MPVETKPRAMPRKAMLLAAGRGERLRPLTDDVPKCMVSIAGRPMLEHNIERLKSFGVTDLVINLHYMPEAVTARFGDGADFGVRIAYSFEQELLGTAGAVRRAASFFDEPFFVWYGDNLSFCRLDNLWALHCAKGGVATIALSYREDPTQSGIVGLDENDRVTRFLEKPRADQVFSNWVSAGIFALEPKAIEAILAETPSDFGRDVFPALLEDNAAIYGYRLSEAEGLWWIDTAADLERVQREAPAGQFVEQKFSR
jgi:NDP-sugar pyrophosphorylase family protein